jgi:predicted amidohydrolase YtcJ
MTVEQAHGPRLFHNGKIHCFDKRDSIADAILIEFGKVVALGQKDDLRHLTTKPVETLDLHGATVLPGLIDTHPHLLHFAARKAPLVDISDAVSHDEIISRIADRARETPAGEWVMTTPVGEAFYFIRRSYRDLAEGELPSTINRRKRRHDHEDLHADRQGGQRYRHARWPGCLHL